MQARYAPASATMRLLAKDLIFRWCMRPAGVGKCSGSLDVSAIWCKRTGFSLPLRGSQPEIVLQVKTPALAATLKRADLSQPWLDDIQCHFTAVAMASWRRSNT